MAIIKKEARIEFVHVTFMKKCHNRRKRIEGRWMNKQVKVLVVEDDPNICELITLYAEKDGYIVNVANDGMTGLELFSENHPDIVILDIMLPEMGGWEVCKEIRRFGKTPIIILTGKGESYDKLKGFNLGTVCVK